jgi:HprK-related kinase A
MRHCTQIRVGPVGFRIGSAWRAPVAALERLYAGYPDPADGVPDFTVRLEPERLWRRWLRPSVAIRGDYMLPDATPLSLAHGLLAAELAMNLQMALGQRRYLLLHASTVERGGRALLMTGESGAGKSTLAALLGERGWRFMGDEFALLDPATGQLHAFPRLVSLKNEAIPVMMAAVPAARFGPELAGTPKGTIRHLRPNAEAITRIDEPATPALLLFPRFGFASALRGVGRAEVFVRLTQASTNYVAMGESGYNALKTLVGSVPACAVDYPDTAAALDLVERLWGELGS